MSNEATETGIRIGHVAKHAAVEHRHVEEHAALYSRHQPAYESLYARHREERASMAERPVTDHERATSVTVAPGVARSLAAALWKDHEDDLSASTALATGRSAAGCRPSTSRTVSTSTSAASSGRC